MSPARGFPLHWFFDKSLWKERCKEFNKDCHANVCSAIMPGISLSLSPVSSPIASLHFWLEWQLQFDDTQGSRECTMLAIPQPYIECRQTNAHPHIGFFCLLFQFTHNQAWFVPFFIFFLGQLYSGRFVFVF